MYGEYLSSGSSITKGLYHLNGNSNDSSGNASNGTDTNVTYSYSNGKFSQGASFSRASSSQIVSSGNTGITGSSARTVNIWASMSNIATSDVFSFWGMGSLSNNLWFRLGYSNSVDKITLSIYGIDLFTSSTVGSIIKDGKMHLISLRFSGGTITSSSLKLSIDNIDYPFSSYSGTPNTTNSQFYIGAGQSGTQTFDGKLDECILENYYWTDNQLNKYYTYARGFFN